VVKVIENKTDAGQSAVFEFKVYKSRQRVLGYLKPYEIRDHGRARWVRTDFGRDAKQVFETVIQLAKQHSIPFVCVDDPEGVFPPDKR
jgi:hypothetical protein